MTTTAHPVSGFAEVNGAQLYYQEAGNGHPLLLIHGGLVHSGMWDDQFEAFAQHFRVIRFDLRGFGRSSSPAGEYAFYQDVRGLLDTLTVDRAHVVGLSMGGKIAIDFALAYPERVTTLLPVASALSGYRFSERTMRRMVEADERLEAGDIAAGVELENRLWVDGPARTPEMVDPAVRERVRVMNTANYQRAADESIELDLEPAAIDRLAEVGVPTLVVAGDQDVPDILAIAELLQRDIGGARLAIISNTAHQLNMERPDEFNRIVLEFLESRTLDG